MLMTLSVGVALLLAQTGIPLEEEASPEFPRTVRRGDQICDQAINANGQIESRCRPAQQPQYQQQPYQQPYQQQPNQQQYQQPYQQQPYQQQYQQPNQQRLPDSSRGQLPDGFTATVGLLGGLLVVSDGYNSGVAGQFTLYGEVGGHVSRSLAVVGVVDFALAFGGGGGTLGLLSLGPGLHFGDKLFGTVALGFVFSGFGGSAFNLGLAGGYRVTDRLTVLAQGRFILGGAAFGFTPGVGLGASF